MESKTAVLRVGAFLPDTSSSMRFQSLYSARTHWVIGTALAVVGVVVARVIAPGLHERMHSGVAATGQIIALAGLVVICFGVRRRVWSSGAEAPSPDQDGSSR